MRKYSGMSPKDPVSQGLLKVHCVIKAWQNTQKMLQKVGEVVNSHWGTLLREALEVCVWRGDKKGKKESETNGIDGAVGSEAEGWRKMKKIFRGSQGQDGKERKRDEGMAGKEGCLCCGPSPSRDRL